MKRRFPTGLARALHRFFQEYLPVQRGTSPHTLRSYRDALLLFLRYAAQDTRRGIEALELDDFTAERIMRFLRHLETQRQNGVATRNARLAALHTFARFLIASCPERTVNYQRVLSIPFKRGAQRVPIDYLELNEVEALLGNINQKTPSGQRDYALFALMFNTGARVQEILNLKVRDVRFDPPNQVRLRGKGNKVRSARSGHERRSSSSNWSQGHCPPMRIFQTPICFKTVAVSRSHASVFVTCCGSICLSDWPMARPALTSDCIRTP